MESRGKPQPNERTWESQQRETCGTAQRKSQCWTVRTQPQGSWCRLRAKDAGSGCRSGAGAAGSCSCSEGKGWNYGEWLSPLRALLRLAQQFFGWSFPLSIRIQMPIFFRNFLINIAGSTLCQSSAQPHPIVTHCELGRYVKTRAFRMI